MTTWSTQQLASGLGFLSTTLLPLLRFAKWIPMLIATTDLAAIAGGKKKDDAGKEEDRSTVAVSGTVHIMKVTNLAEALIGAGAHVNTPGFADPLFAVTPLATQSVTVRAATSIETIDLSGITKPQDVVKLFMLKGSGTTGKFGVGGTYHALTIDMGARAHIDDGATVHAAADITVVATNRQFLVSVAQQGGNATVVGISGAFSLIDVTDTALAYIEDTARIHAGGNILVTATTDFLVVSVSAVLQKGGVVSVGVGVAINSFDTTTRAFIGHFAGPQAAGTDPAIESVSAGGDITVTATSTEALYSVGVAAAQPKQEKNKTQTKANPAGATGAVAATGAATGNGASSLNFGFGLSASIGVNFVSDHTEAFIAVPGAVIAGDDITITATTSSFEVAVAGGIIFSKLPGGITLAGAFTWNELSGHTFGDDSATTPDARITRAFLTSPRVVADDVTVSALVDDRPITISAAIGLVLPKKQDPPGSPSVTINLAGAATVNQHINIVEAYVGPTSALDLTGDLTITARRVLDLLSVTGAVTIKGSFALGAAVEVNIVDDTVLAYIGDGTTADIDGNLVITADAQLTVISVAAALAALAEIEVPITVNVQIYKAVVRAYIGANSSINVGGHVLIAANETTVLTMVAGSAAFLASTAGVGLAVGVADLERTVDAGLRDGVTPDPRRPAGPRLADAVPPGRADHRRAHRRPGQRPRHRRRRLGLRGQGPGRPGSVAGRRAGQLLRVRHERRRRRDRDQDRHPRRLVAQGVGAGHRRCGGGQRHLLDPARPVRRRLGWRRTPAGHDPATGRAHRGRCGRRGRHHPVQHRHRPHLERECHRHQRFDHRPGREPPQPHRRRRRHRPRLQEGLSEAPAPSRSALPPPSTRSTWRRPPPSTTPSPQRPATSRSPPRPIRRSGRCRSPARRPPPVATTRPAAVAAGSPSRSPAPAPAAATASPP